MSAPAPLRPLSPEEWRQISEVFATAMEMPSSERLPFAEQALGKDARLLAEVNRLLEVAEGTLFDLVPKVPEGEATEGGLGPRQLRRLADLAMHSAVGLRPGEMLGERFRIVRLLGRGGMGEVYEAEDLQLQQTIAIKTIRPELSSDAAVLNRFKRELQLARRVSHPNVCRVYDFAIQERSSTKQPVVFLSMEYLPGCTLAQQVEAGQPMEFAQAKPILMQVLSALQAAHAVGVVHRDIKPTNIMLLPQPEGGFHVSVTDFGLAHSADQGHSSLSLLGPAGTPAYIAPEQLRNQRATPASDLYSLGAVMYQLATGRQAWQGDSPLQTAIQRLTSPVVPPREVYAGVHPEWERLILQLLQTVPGDRPASAASVLEQLAEIEGEVAAGRPGQGAASGIAAAVRVEREEPAAPWFSWKRALGLAALLLALTACGLMIWRSQKEELPPAALRWRNEAERAIEYRSFISARSFLQKVLELAPTDYRTLVRLAQVDWELDQQTSALRTLMAVADRTAPNQSDQQLARSIRDLLNGEAIAGTKLLDARRNSVPEEERLRAQLDLLWLLERTPAPDNALMEGEARRMLQMDPTHPGANLTAARLFARVGNVEDARRAFATAQGSFRALGNLEGYMVAKLEEAESLFEQLKGQEPARLLAEAEAAFQTNLAQVSSSFAAHLELRLMVLKAQMASYAGQEDEALRLGIRALTEARTKGLARSTERSLLSLVKIWLRTGKTQSAKELLAPILASGETAGCLRCLGLAKYYLAYIKMREGDCESAHPQYQEAITHLRQAGELPLAARVKTGVAECYQLQGRPAEADRLLASTDAEAARLGATDVRLIVTSLRSQQLSRTGNPQESEKAKRTLLAQYLQPGQDQANANLVRLQLSGLLRQQGRLEESQQMLDEMAELAASGKQPLFSQHYAMMVALLNVEFPKAEPTVAQLTKALASPDGSLRDVHVEALCEVSLQRKQMDEIRRHCSPSWIKAVAKPENRLNQMYANYSRAEWLIGTGKACDGLQPAEISQKAAEALGDVANALYAGLVRAVAAKQCASLPPAEMERARQNVRSLRQKLVESWGSEATKQFWRRYTYRSRWNEVMSDKEKI